MFSLLALLVDKDNDKILCIFKTLQHLTFRCLDYWRCWLIKTKTRFCACLNFTTLNFQMSRLLALLVDKDKDKDKILCIFKTLQNFQMSRLLVLLALLVVFLPNAHSASLPIRWILRLLSDRLEIIDPRRDLSTTIILKTNVLQCRAGWGWGSWTGDRPGRDLPTSKNVRL